MAKIISRHEITANLEDFIEIARYLLKEQGSLSCEYLPETDRINLKNGINIYGTEELNKMLEDFES